MYTCPSCGEIVMEGDPYCPHCGSHLNWPGKSESSHERKDDLNVDDILNHMYINNAQKQLLKLKVNEFLASRDCNSLEVLTHDNIYEYTFIFTRENEYVRTVDEFEYNAKYENFTRVFWECYQSHYHDKLKANPEFRKMIEKTGLEFLDCRGGYVTDYTSVSDEFRMTGEIRVTVSFRAGSKKRIYDLDLDRMELSRDYREWDL
jgi:hypothetical protein